MIEFKYKEPMIFISGEGRSGTTLMRAILGSHPNVTMAGNDYDIVKLYNDMKTKNYPLSDKNSLKHRMMTYGDLKLWNLDWNKFWDIFFYYCKTPEDVIYTIFNNLYDKGNRSRLGMKRPSFIRYIPELEKLFPNSKYIFMIRDPRSVIASKKFLYGEKQFNDLRKIDQLAIRWKKHLIKYRNYYGRYPGQIKKIKYEELITNPSEVIKEICEFVEIDYNPRMLNYDKYWGKDGYIVEAPKSSFPKEINKKVDIYKSVLEKWREKLTDREIKIIERITSPYIKEEGYIAEQIK